MILISFKLKIRFRERTGYALGIEFYEGGWTSRARMLWKSSLWKALWGHCHRRLKTKIKFNIFRQLQPYGTFQGLVQPFHYVLSTFVQNLHFYRYLHSGLQYDIISQPRNGKLSESEIKVFKHINRVALHAESVEFIHPESKKKIKVIAPIPKDMKNVLLILDEYNRS